MQRQVSMCLHPVWMTYVTGRRLRFTWRPICPLTPSMGESPSGDPSVCSLRLPLLGITGPMRSGTPSMGVYTWMQRMQSSSVTHACS